MGKRVKLSRQIPTQNLRPVSFCNLRLYNTRYVLDTERDAPVDSTVLLTDEAASIRQRQWQDIVNRQEKAKMFF